MPRPDGNGSVKIITRHAISNYGSFLQSLATLRTLEKLGCDAKIIDYRNKAEYGLKKVLTESRRKLDNEAMRLAYVAIRYPIEKFAERRFDRMRRRHLSMTETCRSHEDLSRLHANVFMTGSDQVWGPTTDGRYDPAYFLSFVEKGRRVAYAASFGRVAFDDETKNDYRRMLAVYDRISVREDSAVRLIRRLTERETVHRVLDPTLLLDEDDWNKEYPFGNDEGRKEDYILVYQIHNDANLSAYAKALAAKRHMRLVRVSPFLHQLFRGGSFRWCPDAGTFLSLIKNAAYMISDSFHGTCFAIDFNKRFVEILPNDGTDTRSRSLLKLTGLSSRILRNFDDFDLADEPIDYAAVNGILASERKKSMEILQEMVER